MGNFEAVENNGSPLAPKQCLYQKVAAGLDNPKMQSPSRCNKRTGRYGKANNPVQCTSYRAENGNLGNSKLSKTTVPPLHQSNVYIKRKLWVWKAQKCNCLLGAINALGVTAREITRFHALRRRQRREIWETSKPSKTMLRPLDQSNVYIKR